MFQPNSIKTLRSLRQSKQDFFEEIKTESVSQDLAPNQDLRPQTPNPKQASIRNITSATSLRSQRISQCKMADLEALADEVESLLESETSGRNHLTHLYADDQFILHRMLFEEQLVQDAKDTVERQYLLSEMDDTLLNLAIWREDRRLKLKQMPAKDD